MAASPTADRSRDSINRRGSAAPSTAENAENGDDADTGTSVPRAQAAGPRSQASPWCSTLVPPVAVLRVSRVGSGGRLSTMPVAALYTAPHAGARMTSLATVSVKRGLGIDGDRYREGTGHWSDPRWPDQ